MPEGAHWEQRRAVLFELPQLVAEPSAVLTVLQERAARSTHGADLYWVHRLATWLGEGRWGSGSRGGAECGAGVGITAVGVSTGPQSGGRCSPSWCGCVCRRGRSGWGAPTARGTPCRAPAAHGRRAHAVRAARRAGDERDVRIGSTPTTPQTACCRSGDDRPEDHPVYDVTWYEAAAFAAWLDAADPEVRPGPTAVRGGVGVRGASDAGGAERGGAVGRASLVPGEQRRPRPPGTRPPSGACRGERTACSPGCSGLAARRAPGDRMGPTCTTFSATSGSGARTCGTPSAMPPRPLASPTPTTRKVRPSCPRRPTPTVSARGG